MTMQGENVEVGPYYCIMQTLLECLEANKIKCIMWKVTQKAYVARPSMRLA